MPTKKKNRNGTEMTMSTSDVKEPKEGKKRTKHRLSLISMLMFID